jgi:hypothetical protein
MPRLIMLAAASVVPATVAEYPSLVGLRKGKPLLNPAPRLMLEEGVVIGGAEADDHGGERGPVGGKSWSLSSSPCSTPTTSG